LLPLGWAGLLSARGRCQAFDDCADGYIRGEACCGVYLSPLLHQVDGIGLVVDGSPLGVASGTF
ncbi:unnamed protein product, partial [Polarella glacialis]